MTLQQAAQSALDCQDACNLSGLAIRLGEIVRVIRAEGSGTEGCNTHPIVTLYLLKMAELNGCGSTLHETYVPAERECQRLAKGE